MPVVDVCCKGCGLCCRLTVITTKEDRVVLRRAGAMYLTVTVGAEVVPKWVDKQDYLDEEGRAIVMRQDDEGQCLALDPVTRACLIYESRPQVCRDFEYGGVYCRDVVAGYSWVDVSK